MRRGSNPKGESSSMRRGLLLPKVEYTLLYASLLPKVRYTLLYASLLSWDGGRVRVNVSVAPRCINGVTSSRCEKGTSVRLGIPINGINVRIRHVRRCHSAHHC